MTTSIKTITVKGIDFNIWSDFSKRCTYAQAQGPLGGEPRIIRSSGYLSNESSIKKAIRLVFQF